MAPDHSHDTRSGEAGPERWLVFELVISGSQPLSGQIGPPGAPHRIPFHGWIDLMSAIHTLCHSSADNPPAPT
jgi:hypothetical protein